MLIVRRALREQIVILHRRLLAIVRDDEVCRRLMTTPGVGPVVALTYRATVDVPARFRKSKAVGAVFGLTCSKYQSGEIDRSGRISRCGDEMMRVMLYEAAQSMLRSKKWSWLKAWAMQIARRRGMKKAIVALARRLASCTASGLTAPSSAGPGNQPRQQHEDCAGSNLIQGNSSSTKRWNDVPRGTMDEVSSHVRLDLPTADGKAAPKIVPPRLRIP